MKERTPKKICSRIGIALLVMLAVWLVADVALVMAAQFFRWSWANTMWGQLLISSIPLYVFGALAFVLVLRGVPDGDTRVATPMKVGPGKFILILLFCLGGSYLANIITTLILLPLQFGGGLVGDGSGIGYANDWLTWVLMFVFMVLVPATIEEFLFRYMLRRKMGSCGDGTFILFSALCFSLFHLSIETLAYTFVAGAVMAWVYARTGKIWLSMLLHGGFNLFGAILIPLLLEVVGDIIIGGVISAIWMLALIILAIVLFCVFFKRIRRDFAQAREAGWPRKKYVYVASPTFVIPQQPVPAVDAAVYDPCGIMLPAKTENITKSNLGTEIYGVDMPAAAAPAYAATVPYARPIQPGMAMPQPGMLVYDTMPRLPAKRLTFASVCLGNVGMILFLTFGGLLNVLTTASTLLLPYLLQFLYSL